MDLRKVEKLIELLELSALEAMEIMEGDSTIRLSRAATPSAAPVQHHTATHIMTDQDSGACRDIARDDIEPQTIEVKQSQDCRDSAVEYKHFGSFNCWRSKDETREKRWKTKSASK